MVPFTAKKFGPIAIVQIRISSSAEKLGDVKSEHLTIYES